MPNETRKDRPNAVTHISKAKRLTRKRRPEAEPPFAVKSLWAAKVDEHSRTIIVEADIRADMNVGDPVLTTIRKVHYILENAKQAYSDDAARTQLITYMVDIIADYGEPEGIVALKKAAELFGDSRQVREAISRAAARISNEDALDLILGSFRLDASDPKAHMHSLKGFLSQFPHKRDEAISFMEKYAQFDARFAALLDELKPQESCI